MSINIKDGKGFNYIVLFDNHIVGTTSLFNEIAFDVFEDVYIDDKGEIDYNIIDIPSVGSNYNVIWDHKEI